MLEPTAATTTRPSMMVGRLRKVSLIRLSTMSMRWVPPTAAPIPRMTPTAYASTVAASEMPSVRPAPYRIRESTSRSSTSVPSHAPACGAWNSLYASGNGRSFSPYGAMSCPKMATKTQNATTTAPIRPVTESRKRPLGAAS